MIKILLVDDNESSLFVTKSILEKEGFIIKTAINGMNALDKLHKSKPDLIISDILMPIMDGFTLCKEIKNDRELKNIPLIFLSSIFTEAEDEQLGIDLGAESFIKKDQKSENFIKKLLEQIELIKKEDFISTRTQNSSTEKTSDEQFNFKLIQKLQTKVDELENLQNIIQSVSSILIGIDNSGVIELWNLKAEQQFNIEKEDAIGKKLNILFPEFKVEIDRAINASRNRQILNMNNIGLEKHFPIKYANISVTPLISNTKEGAVIRIDDISEKIQMEKKVIQSEKMLSIGGLAAGMAHEINNPMAGMIQTACVMEKRLGSQTPSQADLKSAAKAGISIDALKLYMKDRDIYKMLDNIRESGKRITEIIENMLSFARKSGNGRKSSDISEILDKTLDLITVDSDPNLGVDFKVIEFHREYSKNRPSMKCEESKIQQVILNVLYNAAQAMFLHKTDNPQIYIRTKTSNHGAILEIEIEDNGPGIPKELQNKIFEPFFTTKGNSKGTGLGLSISYFIITIDLKGEISVESQLEKGATFTIRIPCII